MFKLFNRKPELTENQFERLANIFDNAGQVIFGVVVLAPIIAGFDKINLFVVISGVSVMIACWLISLWFAKKGD